MKEKKYLFTHVEILENELESRKWNEDETRESCGSEGAIWEKKWGLERIQYVSWIPKDLALQYEDQLVNRDNMSGFILCAGPL